MAIAANDRFPRLRRAEFGADHVHDAALLAVKAEEIEPELRTVLLHLGDLAGRLFANDRKVLECSDGCRWRGVIHCREREFGATNRQSLRTQQ